MVSVHGVLLFSGCLALRKPPSAYHGVGDSCITPGQQCERFSLSRFKLGLSEDAAQSVCIGARSVHHVAATPTSAELDT